LSIEVEYINEVIVKVKAGYLSNQQIRWLSLAGLPLHFGSSDFFAHSLSAVTAFHLTTGALFVLLGLNLTFLVHN
jgi:hypothetical protein